MIHSLFVRWTVILLLGGLTLGRSTTLSAQNASPRAVPTSNPLRREESERLPISTDPSSSGRVAAPQRSAPSASPNRDPASPGNGTPQVGSRRSEAQVAPASATSQPTARTSLTPKRIAELSKQVREAPALDDEAKAELLKRYQSASNLLKAVDEARRRIAEYEQDIQQGAQAIEAAKQELASPPPDATAQSHADKTAAELETVLKDAERRLSDARTRLDQRESELKNRAERRSDLANKIDEVSERLTEAEKALKLPAPQGESPKMTKARRIETEARRISLSAASKLYQTETQRLGKLADLFPLKRDLVKRETNLLEKEVEHLQTLVGEVRKRESERQVREALRQAELADPALRDIAEQNAELAQTRKTISENVTKISVEVKRIDEHLKRLNHEYEGARSKVDKAGHSTTVGLLLRRQREVLPSESASQQRLRFVQSEMPVVNLQRMELEDERSSLGDISTEQANVLRHLDQQLAQEYGEHLPGTVRDLLTTRNELFDELIDDLDTYLFALGELESNHRDLIEQTGEFRQFIDEHVLWIRSTDAIQLATLPRIRDDFAAIVAPQPWLRLLADSGLDTLREPGMAMSVLASVILLLVFQARLRRKIRKLCESRSNSLGSKFYPAIRALLLIAAASAAWPLLIGYVGWQMNESYRASDLGHAVGPALVYAAGLLWLSAFVRMLCRSDGVAATFFSWPPSGLTVARNAVRWLTWLGVPLTSVVFVTQYHNQGVWAESIGRIAFVLVMLLLAAFTHATLGSRKNVFRESIAKEPKGWLSRMRVFAYSAGMMIPLTLSLLATIGYYYSAQQLAVRFQKTLAMGLASLLVHAVVSRWFIVKRRRLAMEQSRERQQAAQSSQEDSTDAVVAVPTVDQAPDWDAVHERLRLLLRQAVTVGVLLGCWLIWSDVLPALNILDNVEMWTKTVEVTESFEDADGNMELVKGIKLSRTTLRHALIAAIVLLATFLLGRNLPALLEITILNRLPLDRGGRHAVSLILYYSVALTGVIVALRTLNINWASVQWLAAGITVGLGFGLQEIFANFVSGMILLIERPIRVGDIITLGDVTGTVTNIQIRATTVTNWDRKELIVPNKDLITGRLLNWTLSDTTNRIVIKVGIAYESDVVAARNVMEQTVTAHPNVLSDPAPIITFEAFGDSTLDFVIRVYLASLDVRLVTTHELHVALHQRLKEEGIEIAFPQRDLNIRNLDVAAQMLSPERQVGTIRSDAA